MKKIILLSVLIALTLLSSAQRKIGANQAEALWSQASIIYNTLDNKNQFVNYGEGEFSGRIKLFIGKAGEYEIKMCVVELPQIMNSQRLCTQIIVNGRQKFDIPTKISYQVYDTPRLSEGVIIIKAYIGMYDVDNVRFYIIINPITGDGYTTKILRDN